jgi:hypothetical protein
MKKLEKFSSFITPILIRRIKMNLSKNDYKKEWIRGIIIIFWILTALYLAGCSSANQSSQFPIGLFDCVECQGFTERYSGDGTLIVYMRGNEYITGKWYIEGDVFHTGDSFCNDKDEMPGAYKWHFDGEILTFRVIEDACSDRVNSLNEKPWKLIEE